MSETVIFVRNTEFEKIKDVVNAALGEIDGGAYDAELKAAGHSRSSDTPIKGRVHLSQGQGLSPEDWRKIIVDFGPLAVDIMRIIWPIIVAKLKYLCHEDQVSEHDPRVRRRDPADCPCQPI